MYCSMNVLHIKVVGRNSCLFEAFLPVHLSRVKCCMNNSEKFFCNSSFKGEVSSTVNLERWEDADVRLLITTYADNKPFLVGKRQRKTLLLFIFLLVISYFLYFKFVTFKTSIIFCNTLKKEGRAFRNIGKYIPILFNQPC